MITMVKVKAAELTGAALDWCIGLTKGAEFVEDYGRPCLQFPGSCAVLDGLQRDRYIIVPKYSSTWEHVGPLVDEHDVWLSDDEGACVASCYPHTGSRIVEGNTNLIAICRAIVVARLGVEVEVPQELLG